jgi:peptidoglycan/LPS O-acetylase OafA/YrhL
LQALKHRPEIDGLRAVAVLPVILYHAGASLFSGGYVGVDVFFVISGFLITGILLQEMAEARFSLIGFYERRARRILPALAVVMLCTLPFAWMWMQPIAFKAFAKSLVATTAFSSNILFWLESGYFAPSTLEKPLLHTWSLAVEEQYYLVFPLVLMGLMRFGRKPAVIAIGTVALLSLGLAQLGRHLDTTANFYLAPSRAWELLAGSLCAFLPETAKPRSSQVLSLLGLGLIAYAVFAFDWLTPFPSLYTLAPVVGTVLVLTFASENTWVGRLLSTRPFVAVGLISYSAYLWHQPLFAFARIRSLGVPAPWLMALLVVVTLLLAWASWRWVEQPFRRRTGPSAFSRRQVFTAAAAVTALFISAGMIGFLGDGLSGRFPARTQAAMMASVRAVEDINPYRGTCHMETGRHFQHPLPACADFMTDQIDVAIIGDSHASALALPVQQQLKALSMTSYSATYTGCVGVPRLERVFGVLGHQCSEFMTEMTAFLKQEKVPTVVVASRWTFFWDGRRFDNGEGGVEFGSPDYLDLEAHRFDATPADDEARRARVLQAYVDGIRQLAEQFDVVLVYPIPEAGWNVPEQVAKRAMFGGGPDAEPLTTDYAVYRARNGPVIAAFDAIDSPHVLRVKPAEILCDTFVPGRCINADSKTIFYADDDHISLSGAAYIAPEIVARIEEFAVRRGTTGGQ